MMWARSHPSIGNTPVSHTHSRRRAAGALLVAPIALIASAHAGAQATPPASSSPSRLTLERIFASGEFAARGAGQLRWLNDSTYVALQGNPQQPGAAELARFNARTGARDVIVPTTWLTPNGAAAPLDVEDYDWSSDRKRLLVFTASEKV